MTRETDPLLDASDAEPETASTPASSPLDPALLAASLCLAAALNRRPDLSRLVVARVWSAEWCGTLEQAWDRLPKTKSSCPGLLSDFPDLPVEERWNIYRGDDTRTRGRLPGDKLASIASSLRMREPCCILMADEEAPLDPCIEAAADASLVVEAPTPEMIGSVAGCLSGAEPTHVLDAATCSLLTPNDMRLAVRPRQSADDYLSRLERIASTDKTKEDEETAPALDSLHGMDAAVEWGRSLAADLKLYAVGRLPWSAVDRGVLLVGPPGVGKTTFAKALAASCGVPLIASSYAEWQSAKGGHLGDLLQAMRKTFDAARKQAPCILFIDEIDSFRNRKTDSRNADWWANVIGALLELLDGVQRRDGVVVVAATNHSEVVDPALMRSGRLDRIISIPLPDQGALARILRMHLGDDLRAADLAPLAACALGGTGADVERWVRGARRRARQSGASVSVENLAAEILGNGGKPKLPAYHVRVHEAGHALLVALEEPGSLVHVVLRHQEGTAAQVVIKSVGAVTDTRVGSFIRQLLAGRAAEQLVVGQVTGGSGGDSESDLAQATRLAVHAETALGFGKTPLLWRGLWEDQHLASALLADRRLARRTKRRLEREWNRVFALLRRNRPVLDALVTAFEERPVLSGTEVETLVGQHTARAEGTRSGALRRVGRAADRFRVP